MGTLPRDAKAEIRYFNPAPPSEVLQGDVIVLGDVGGGTPEDFKRRRRLVTVPHEVMVQDARTAIPGGLEAWKLDTHGFCAIPAPPVEDFSSHKRVKEECYPHWLELVKSHITGVKHAFITNHILRDEKPENMTTAYARFAHTDFGPDYVQTLRESLVRRGVPKEEAETCRISMMNVWFPIERPAFKDPLCLLDASTVSLEDQHAKYRYLVNSGLKNQDDTQMYSEKNRNNEASATGPWQLGVCHSASHRWVFLPDMREDQAWLFKQWDSGTDVARCSFHNSFHDPFHDQEPNCPARRSIEFRTLLTYYGDASGATSSRL